MPWTTVRFGTWESKRRRNLPPISTLFGTQRCKILLCSKQASNLHMTNCMMSNHSAQLTPKCSIMYIKLPQSIVVTGGPGSSVVMATELRAGRSGIESRWGRDFPPIQIGPGAHPASCTMGIGYFPGVKCCRGVLLTTDPLLVPRSWKSRAIPQPTLWATPSL